MSELDREIAGLRCRDVLAQLSDYLDHLLSPERLAAVEAHLAACPLCARFGGNVSAILTALGPSGDVIRSGAAGAGADGLADARGAIPGPISPAALERLRATIGRATDADQDR